MSVSLSAVRRPLLALALAALLPAAASAQVALPLIDPAIDPLRQPFQPGGLQLDIAEFNARVQKVMNEIVTARQKSVEAALAAARAQDDGQRARFRAEEAAQRELAEAKSKELQQLLEEMTRLRQQPGAGFRAGVRVTGALGRLGAHVTQPTAVLIDQLNLPEGQGLVVSSVMPDSPAAKAGMLPHDILLEMGGKPVPSHSAEFIRMVAEFKADTPMDVVVLRKGKKETLRGVTLPEVAAVPPVIVNPRGGGIRFPDPLASGGDISIERNGERFSAARMVGAVNVIVTGKADGGKVEVGEILVEEAGNVTRYGSVDKVPPALAPAVREIIRRVEISSGGR